MIGLALAIVVLSIGLIPAVMVVINLRLYRPPPPVPADPTSIPRVSLLIPARDEEDSIGAAVESALLSRGVDLEVIVLDDHSQDATAARVRDLAARDPRVRLEPAPPLPGGWCGKQHACAVLARHARFDVLAWIDADVRLAPDALARMAGLLARGPAALISGIPRQITASPVERAIIPMIHFVLLGYLPIPGMRRTLRPAYGAGCGQLFMATRAAYDRAGGHAAIRGSLHDGVMLPRSFRRAGLATDLCDATDLAACRMYRGALETFRGFAKNATEGMAAPRAIVPWTILLLCHAAPWFVSPVLIARPDLLHPPVARLVWHAALVVSALTVATLALRFRQGSRSFILHPLGVVMLLSIQWYALAARGAGRPMRWKDRAYAAGTACGRQPNAM